MKTIVLSLISLTASTFLAFSGPTDKKAKNVSYLVNAQKSKLTWNAKKVTGAHAGTAPVKSGQLNLSGGKLTGGHVEINLKDLVVTDIKDPEYNAKLVSHLKNDDFFAVEKFPVATLEIVSATSAGTNKYTVKGKLTIKGITKDVTFPADIDADDKKLTANAKLAIDRTQYGIRYNSKSFFSSIGDKAIEDNFNLDVSLFADVSTAAAKSAASK
ncbi:Polyisoprenoid-binding protein YceI [Dyadobacter koreensis]|uniref:Polyisoprenoid-binding protein YceI n=1 Tax=Dyadobacter koreensis TaxID=408657 RepID=A0A1H6VCT4_9BACT|nr:YceI family protein [Dyadobacter koreensis]SEJ02393.1 Polyisoprenoid-binding protein YceI [Dyadobacter koreensis]